MIIHRRRGYFLLVTFFISASIAGSIALGDESQGIPLKSESLALRLKDPVVFRHSPAPGLGTIAEREPSLRIG